MKKHSLILIAAVMLCLPLSIVAQEQASSENTYEEYSYYNKAKTETDLAKKEAAVFEFIEKYPESKLMVYLGQEFTAVVDGLLQKKEYDHAIATIQKYQTMRNDDQAVQLLAKAYYFKQDFANYLVNCEIIYAKNPDVQMAYFMSDAAIKLPDFARAEKYLAAVEEKGNLMMKLDLAFKLFTAYQAKADAPHALASAQKVVALLENAEKPADFQGDWAATRTQYLAPSYGYIGNSSLMAKNFEGAAGAFEKILGLNPKDAASYLYLGVSYWMGGKAPKAAPAFAKAVVLNNPQVSPKAEAQLKKLLETAQMADKYNEFLATAKADLGIQ